MANLILVENFVRKIMANESSGHDWFHVQRVCNNAKMLANHEVPVDLEVVLGAAFLHDIPDRKLTTDVDVAYAQTEQILIEAEFSASQRAHVLEIIRGVSYLGAGVETPMHTLEGKLVQDADRLDALGAIGIARCFAYGGKKGRLLYDPNSAPQLHSSADNYFQSEGTSLNHFYEKLLLLQDRMQTVSGKKAAAKRHRYLEDYLNQFLSEWNGQDLPD